ncbi:hypothetical protein [Thermoanaerobacter pentosaceus]|uniref:Uncharacterized protein n=1 Tax=Thermoanaerobacter pentosaceus TaxID=694059 RepID=A0ABT9M2S6_9THEO|nr:hypothetical protein [Thermoanaerobacter pentosaceus]MDP9750407.1 hypothetical protein [Thermoanaerobacter pentosaceus]
MKVSEFIKKYSLENLFLPVLEEHNNDTAISFMLFITDSRNQIKKEYKDFYNTLKNLTPDKNIKGKIIFDLFSGGIIETENTKNERLEFLNWEEVLALEVSIDEESSSFEKLLFIDHLLYLITMHGRAFDLKTKKKIEYEEKIKENLIPKVNTAEEKFLHFLEEVLYIFKSPFTIPVLFAGIVIAAKYTKTSAYILAALIDSNPSTIPAKLIIMLGLFLLWYLSFSAYNKLDNYLDEVFKTKLKKNIEDYLKEHPDASTFLNTEYFENLNFVISLKEAKAIENDKN